MNRARAGVVMLDVVLTLAILGLAALVAYPRLLRSDQTAQVAAQTARAAAVIRRARAEAIRTRTVEDVRVPFGGGWIASRRERAQFGPGVRVTWIPSSQCPRIEGGRALRFLPDGRSCGGLLTAQGRGAAFSIRVDWLTGRVEQWRRE
jgi:general secretion pathway protein H